jgi:hypothetical protein
MTTNVGGFWLYTPTGASASSDCLIFLHGMGDQGSGSSSDLNILITQGLCKIVNDTMGTAFEFPHDCILVFPQYTGGTPTLFRVQGIIDYVKANITFDQNKLHLSGYSLGAAGVTGWWEIGDLSDVASCSITATPSTYYESGAVNVVAYNMPTLFLHGTLDVHPTAYAYSVNWVNELNADGVNPASVLFSVTNEGHNIDETVYDYRSYQVEPGKNLIEWHQQFSRASGSTSGASSGVATVTGNATVSSSSASGTISGTSTVTGAAKSIVKVTGTSSGLATTEGAKTYINVGASTQVINGQNWIGLSDAQVTGGVFTDVYVIWGESWNQTILNTDNEIIYRSQRRTNSICTINYPATNGSYTLRLHFCEFWKNNANDVFNLSIEGSQVLTGFNVWTAAGGRYRAYYQDFPVSISDGSLTIQITPTAGEGMLNAFELIAPGADAKIITGISGTIAGFGSAAAGAIVIGSNGGATSGSSTVTGQAKIINLSTGTSSGSSTVSSQAGITTKASGSIEGTSTTSSIGKVIAIASGSASGLASLSVTESGVTYASASAQGTSTTSAQGAMIIPITGSVAGTSNTLTTGDVSFAGVLLVGDILINVSGTGNIQTSINKTSNIAI